MHFAFMQFMKLLELVKYNLNTNYNKINKKLEKKISFKGVINMVNKRYTALYVLLALIPTIYLLTVFGTAPDQVPTHFTAEGIADAYSTKWTLVIMPVVVTACAIGGLFAPFLTQYAKQKDDKSLNAAARFYIIVLLFLDAVSVNVIYDAIHYTDGDKATLVINILYLLNAFILLSGFFLPKLKRNGVIGIRLPFTLIDDRNWDRTHNMGGKLFIIAGIVGLVLTFITNGSFWGGMLPLFVAMGLTFLYSAFTFYKK